MMAESRRDEAVEDIAVKGHFEEICRRLNMDGATEKHAWDSYCTIKDYFNLEGGGPMHWLSCALFVACRSAIVPTLQSGHSVRGNRVSLTHILRETKVSLLEFFNKMDRWVEMVQTHGLPEHIKTDVDNLFHQFKVITITFRKYDTVFNQVFQTPAEDRRTGKKSSRRPCTTEDLFKFGWTLFVRARASINAIQDDLVNSYHLLLCVVDTLFTGAHQIRTDLLNPAFRRRAEEKAAEQGLQNNVSSIEILCEDNKGSVVEVKTIREHWLLPYLETLRRNGILHGDSTADLIDVNYFYANNKDLNASYDRLVVNEGDLDERVFLNENAQEEVGTPIKVNVGPSVTSSEQFRHTSKNLQTFFKEASRTGAVVPATPLSGAYYVKHRGNAVARHRGSFTPVSTAVQNLTDMKSIVHGVPKQPSESLKKLFSTHCNPGTEQYVVDLTNNIGKVFVEKYCDGRSGASLDSSLMEEAERLRDMAISLYFKVLEAMLLGERRRERELQPIVAKEVFHRSLLACCLHIMLVAKNSSYRRFPWILEAIDLEPYDFLKVIELTIRHESRLNRAMIMHLKHAEELILESLAWRTGSSLFGALKNSGQIYKFEQVCLPEDANLPVGTSLQSPASATFQGESKSCTPARRNLFRDEQPVPGHPAPGLAEPGITPLASSCEAAALITMAPTPMTVTASPTASQPGMSSSPSVESVRGNQCAGLASPAPSPQQTPCRRFGNSFALFLRKVYHLVSLRLKDLCLRLQIKDELRQIIWTAFEEAFVKHGGHEMRDRHLDQFLLCSIYGICKVHQQELDFSDLVKIYCLQPHAKPQTYRHVLVWRAAPTDSAASSQAGKGLTDTVEKQAAGSSLVKSPSSCVMDSPSSSPARSTRGALRKLQGPQEGSMSPRRSPRKRPHEDSTPASPHRPSTRRSQANVNSPSGSVESPPTKRRRTAQDSNPEEAVTSGDEPMVVDPDPKPQPGSSSGDSSTDAQRSWIQLDNGEYRGDIICFYNNIYVPLMKDFLLSFAPQKVNVENRPHLSPMPKERIFQFTRRPLSRRHNIFISPMKKSIETPRADAMLYCVQKSSLLDLRHINEVIALKHAQMTPRKPTAVTSVVASPVHGSISSTGTRASLPSPARLMQPAGLASPVHSSISSTGTHASFPSPVRPMQPTGLASPVHGSVSSTGTRASLPSPARPTQPTLGTPKKVAKKGIPPSPLVRPPAHTQTEAQARLQQLAEERWENHRRDRGDDVESMKVDCGEDCDIEDGH